MRYTNPRLYFYSISNTAAVVYVRSWHNFCCYYISIFNFSHYDGVCQEVAAERESVQKQVDVWHWVEQSQDKITMWLNNLLEQFNQAVNSPPKSAQLLELIARYQVCHSYCLSAFC